MGMEEREGGNAVQPGGVSISSQVDEEEERGEEEEEGERQEQYALRDLMYFG